MITHNTYTHAENKVRKKKLQKMKERGGASTFRIKYLLNGTKDR